MAVYLVDFENVNSPGIAGIQKLTKEDKVYIFYTANASSMSFAAHLNLLSSPAEVVYYNVSSGGKNALDFQLSSFLGYLICQGKEKRFCIISNDRGYEYVKNFWERSGLAVDISISGAPSVNRALLPFEKPFTAKIQQQEEQTEEIAEQAPVQTIEEAVSEPEPEKEEETGYIPEIKEEKKPASKKRGRPKKNNKKTDNAAKIENVPESLKNALAKADVTDEKEIMDIMELLKKSEGKQQFYRGIIKIYGMERGVAVYKAVRIEYGNLMKLVRN